MTGNNIEISPLVKLKQALTKEKLVGTYEIATIVPQFYDRVNEYIREIQNEKERTNVESMLLELFRMRRGKLTRIADAIELDQVLFSKLAVPEIVFYKSVYDAAKKFEDQTFINTK